MPWQSLPPIHVDGAVNTASLKHIYLCNIAIVDPHILYLLHKSRKCGGHWDLGDPLWRPCGSHMSSFGIRHLNRSMQAGPTWAYVFFSGMQNDTFGLRKVCFWCLQCMAVLGHRWLMRRPSARKPWLNWIRKTMWCVCHAIAIVARHGWLLMSFWALGIGAHSWMPYPVVFGSSNECAMWTSESSRL